MMRPIRFLSPWMQTPLPPGHMICDACWEANPSSTTYAGHVTCEACWEATPPIPVDRMTDMCKNINLPQTSFAGGN